MVWLIAFLCLGIVGALGYHQGPVRAAFSFLGIVFGAALAGPLSPLTKHLLPLIGLSHPAWQVFVPQAIAFLMVLIIFKIAGQVLHSKLAVHYKYKVDDRTRINWERMYSRVGMCVGFLNGTAYFILLMIPLYVGGYFTTEAHGENDPAGARFLTGLRTDLHDDNMDKVLATYDPTPTNVYEAADIVSLVLHNPILESRLTHYPPLLELAQRPEFHDLASDVQLQQMVQTQASVREILDYPKVQAILTNTQITAEITGLLGHDLDDLRQYLMTGQSDKYDQETILGVWRIDRAATMEEERERRPGLTTKQIAQIKSDLYPIIAGLSLTALPDKQMILKKGGTESTDDQVVATGTWSQANGAYKVDLPGSRPETTDIVVQANKLHLPKDDHVLVFEKEM